MANRALSTERRADAALSSLLFAATVLYLAAFPRDLGMSDEAYFLYEAARIRNGEVMYRDIFQFITPLSAYAMALLFRVFGTSIDTARLGTAVLHGLIAALLFAICRRLGVRRTLAAVTPLAYLAICQPAWPYASWHWFSTCFAVLLLWAMLGEARAPAPRRALLAGLACGAVIGVQQQKGVTLAAGMVVVFCIDHLLRRRAAAGASAALPARLAAFAAGIALIVVPLLAYSLASAGFGPLYDALIRWPLETYGAHFHVAWGKLGLLSKSFAARTYPVLLRWSPLVLAPLALRAAADLAARRYAGDAPYAPVLLGTAAASIVSILYYPDLIHIAFIAPVFLVCAAEALDWQLRRLRRAGLARGLGCLAAAAAIAAFAPRLVFNLERARRELPIAHDTAFGRIAFAERWQAPLIDHVRALLRDIPSRELFCYANVSSPYLTMGANNPTPFQFFLAGLSPDSQTRTVLSILEQRRLPYILGAPFFMKPDDPVVRFIAANYERVDIPAVRATGERPGLELYRRKDAPAPSGATRAASP